MSSARLSACLQAGLFCVGALATGFVQALPSDADRIEIPLHPTRFNAGKTGVAVLHRSGDRATMNVAISGVPFDAVRPIHLYPYLVSGSCESRSQAPAYALPDDVLSQSLVDPMSIAAAGPAHLSYPVDLPFDRLRSAPFAVSVRLSPAEGNREIFCGNSVG